MNRLAGLGEFGLIKRFSRLIKTDFSVIKGPGDDCAVIKLDKNKYQLFTCDMLVEGVDFTLRDDPYLIGRKAIAVSLSDIAACCGVPRHCLISLGLPKKTALRYLDKLFKGLLDTARKYRVNIIGGDLSRSNKVVIDVAMIGEVEKKYLALRSNACPGDIIFVSGTLGGSFEGKHLRFTPRLKEARFLAKNLKINSMIDISDGLSQDLGHILSQSKVGAVIYESLLPLSRSARNLGDALNNGEDFELLFTLCRSQAEKLFKLKNFDFKPIGEIVEAKYGFQLIDKNCRVKNIVSRGFRHF